MNKNRQRMFVNNKYLDMILIDPLWDWLEDRVDYETYFGKEVWDERKIGNENWKKLK